VSKHLTIVFWACMIAWIAVHNGLELPRGFLVTMAAYWAGIGLCKVLVYFTREAAKAHARRILTTMPTEDDREAFG
jgi:hypothetical protein